MQNESETGMTYHPDTLAAINRLGLAFDELDLPPVPSLPPLLNCPTAKNASDPYKPTQTRPRHPHNRRNR
jgi:hypothetical protein